MCKMAHFGNCDPETKDQEYCIFHKPNKSEEEAREFYNKFVLRFFGYVLDIEKISKKKLENFEHASLSTAENVPSESKPIMYYLAKFRFGKKIDAKGFVFPKLSKKVNSTTKTGEDFTFENAVFENHVSFYQAIFEGLVSFGNFSGAVFHGDAQFSGTDFGGINFFGANFEGEASFGNCTFRQFADFQLVRFNENVIFNMSEFKKQAYFNQTHLKSMAYFRGCKFEGYITFSKSLFEDNADFKYCKFRDIVEFQDTSFKGNVYFDNSRFEYVASFESTDSVESINTNLNVRFHKILSFANCDFRQGADFLGSLKNESNTSRLWDFLTTCFSNFQALIEAVRVQRLSFEKEGKREEADRMFVLEMPPRGKSENLSSQNLQFKKQSQYGGLGIY